MHTIFVIRAWVSALASGEERGASAVEYGLLIAGIAAVAVAGVFLFGGALNDLLGESCGTIMFWVRNQEVC